MPTYEYECETCGPFTEQRPMAEFASPQPCPDCNSLSPRMLTIPQISGGSAEPSASGPSPAAHAGGCACCAAPRRFAAEAV